MTNSVPSNPTAAAEPLAPGADAALAGFIQLFAATPSGAPSLPGSPDAESANGDTAAFAQLLDQRAAPAQAPAAMPPTPALWAGIPAARPVEVKFATAITPTPGPVAPIQAETPPLSREQQEEIAAALAAAFFGALVAPVAAQPDTSEPNATLPTSAAPQASVGLNLETPHSLPVSSPQESGTPLPEENAPTTPAVHSGPASAGDLASAKASSAALELRLPNGQVVRVAWPASPAADSLPGVAFARQPAEGQPAPAHAQAAVGQGGEPPRADSGAARLVVPSTESLAEKNAAPGAHVELRADGKFISSEKIALTADARAVGAVRKKAGIGVAKVPSDMPALAPHFPEAPLAPETRAALVSGFTRAVFTPDHSAISEESAPPAVVAQRAVQTVLSAVELQSLQRLNAQPGVSLRLQVGAEEVAVRIELAEGVVRTEFRAESAPLLAALKHEWQASVARSELPVQFAAPAFTDGAAPVTATDWAMAGWNFREQAQRQAGQEQFGRVARSYPVESEEPAAAVVPLSPAANPLSVHLSAVA